MSGKTGVPEEAVEAAAKAEYEHEFLALEGTWASASKEARALFRQSATAALEAAAPFIAAKALEGAAEAWQVRMDTIGRGSVEAKVFMQVRAAAVRGEG